MKPITYLAIGLFVGVLLKSATGNESIGGTAPYSMTILPNTSVGVLAVAAKTKSGTYKTILVDDDGRVVCAP